MPVRKTIYIIFTLSVILLWGVNLFKEWGTDFGSIYASSYFIDDNYQLYKDVFSHKGPLYFLFIQALGGVIGWGVWQAYVTLVITSLTFYLSIIYILSKRVLNNKLFIIILSISLLLLYKQGTNLAYSLFQGGFLLLSFYYLMESIATIDKNRTTEYVISVSLFVCAVLVRIDVLIYAPAYLVAIIFSSINRQSYLFILQRILTGLFILIALYMANQIYFGYNIYEFYQHNIEFNSYYASTSLLAYIFRPLHFSILMNSGVIVLFLIVLLFKYDSIIKKYESSSIYAVFKTHNGQIYITSILIVLLGIILWIVSNSDKNYHVFIVAIPLLFFVSYWGKVVNNISDKLIFVSAPIILYMLMLTISVGVKHVLKDKNCLTDIYCSESSIFLYRKTINNISTKDSATIIGGGGWPYLFADTKPERAINDWWIYYRKEAFVTKYLLEAHNKLLNQPAGYEFWIDNGMLDSSERSDYFYEILDKSELVENEGKYSRYRIKVSKK
jgi:hypothetical protein